MSFAKVLMIDQSTKSFTTGCKIVVGGLTDGKYFLPVAMEQWIAEFILGNNYLTMVQLAEKLILRVLELGIFVAHYVMDGLYFSAKFIQHLDAKKLHFLIKAKITTSVLYKDQILQLQNCKDLRLNGNQNQKKIVANCLLQILMKKFRLDCIEDSIRKAQALKNKVGFLKTVDRISLLAQYA